jgi:hypothetical protein
MVLTSAVGTASAATPVLDQEYWPSDPFFAAGTSDVRSNVHKAQTFTAGVTGRLDSVEVAGYVYSTEPGAMKAWVTSLDEGMPGAGLIGSTAIASPPTAAPWNTFTIDLSGAGVDVEAGKKYSLVLSGVDTVLAQGATAFSWAASIATDGYAGGSAWGQIGGGPWTDPGLAFIGGQPGAVDFYFRTYVTPVPEPTSVGGIAGIAAACAIVRRRTSPRAR